MLYTQPRCPFLSAAPRLLNALCRPAEPAAKAAEGAAEGAGLHLQTAANPAFLEGGPHRREEAGSVHPARVLPHAGGPSPAPRERGSGSVTSYASQTATNRDSGGG